MILNSFLKSTIGKKMEIMAGLTYLIPQSSDLRKDGFHIAVFEYGYPDIRNKRCHVLVDPAFEKAEEIVKKIARPENKDYDDNPLCKLTDLRVYICEKNDAVDVLFKLNKLNVHTIDS